MILTNFGYKITPFSGSREVLNYFKANDNLVPMFDLLPSDMVMPFMNGRNLANEICALQPGIKVLFMSGYVGDTAILAAVQDADIPFLENPSPEASSPAKSAKPTCELNHELLFV